MIDFYQVACVTGWTWEQWTDTPPTVRDIFMLHMRGESDARKAK